MEHHERRPLSTTESTSQTLFQTMASIASWTNYSNPNSIGARMRQRRIAHLVTLISNSYAPGGRVSILDVGGRKEYWNSISSDMIDHFGVQITIVNLEAEESRNDQKWIRYLKGDACDLRDFDNNSFDIVHSNSVIEHVGNWQKIVAFATETRRLAPHHYIQTPNFWFPMEPHFIKPFHHWMPRPWRVSMWRNFNMGQRHKAKDLHEAMVKIEDEPYLLDRRTLGALYPDSRIVPENFFGFTKSLIAIR